jgi:allene oxide cyclase
MHRNLKFAAAVGVAMPLIIGGWVAVGASGSSNNSSHPTIHVIEHADTDTEILIGPQGPIPPPGNTLVFHNPVFNSSNTEQVGSDQGDCIRIVSTAAEKTWECRWITQLDGGGITVEGPFSEKPNQQTILAVTGGTGKFSHARGEMILHAVTPDELQFDFIFHLTGVTSSADN